MNSNRGGVTLLLFFVLVFAGSSSRAGETGAVTSKADERAANATVQGTVKDAETGNALPSANILIVGTGLGASTDVDGKYIIHNVPEGLYKVRASYVGYETVEVPLEAREGETVTKNFKLRPVSIQGEEVIVTAQALGQKEAINRQLASMPVMNVVSSARIQELPDANAAESVARLPGVSLIRTGGEGSQVVIRGLSPQYNQITIDGVELPSDLGSSNNVVSHDADAQASTLNSLGDRGEDLSMISSSMLGGIEVIKAITPDMDATLIGGVVNFDLRKAARSTSMKGIKESWFPSVEIRSQGGYNNLKSTYDDYKFIGSVERRFFDESFGVFVLGSTERRNLSANDLGASYVLYDKDHGDAGIPDLVSLNLSDVIRQRKRLGAQVVLDYQHEKGQIALMSSGSSSDTRTGSSNQIINQVADNLYYSGDDSHNKINIFNILLSIKQDIPLFHVDLKGSRSYTENKDPEDLFFNFYQEVAGLRNHGDLTKVTPNTLASFAVPVDSLAGLDQLQTSYHSLREGTWAGSLDMQTDMSVSDLLAVKIKFGGAYQYRTREYDYAASSGSQLFSGGGGVVTAMVQAYPWLQLSGGRLSLVNFVSSVNKSGNLFSGDYSLPYSINPSLMWMLLPIAKHTGTLEGYQVNKLASAINNYSGNEAKSAAYAMATFNFGDLVTVLPGVRYQNLTTTYTAMRGELIPQGLAGKDTTVTEPHGYFLPMVHVRYKPLDWFQLHFAYTNTLNYPDYGAITPRYLIGQSFIDYNNYRLKPLRSENYDLVASIYSNEVGLLSVNGFKKRIKDLIFFSHTYLTDLSEYPDLPQGRKLLYEFNTYINSSIPVDLWGIETEWQTHFWYLPQPFTGIVFNINYTHIFSEATYPRDTLVTQYDEFGNYSGFAVPAPYKSRLLNQPKDIVNFALGYDYEGFSARLSMLYQDNVFRVPDFWMQNRVNSAKYVRWDLSVKQELPWFGIQLYFDLNNISGENDVDVNQKTSFPASEERYGMTADAGLRIKL
jgi:TonB-dependent receptor